MGAEHSVDASYTLGEPLKCENKFWKIYPAVRKADDISATVFVYNKEGEGHGVYQAVKYLRILRHPGLLKCQEVFETADEISVVTEPVVPLPNVIGDLNVHELIAGIHAVIRTLEFLHDKCKLSHNNLCMESVVVGQNDACWKIAGFECMCAFSDTTNEEKTHARFGYAQDAFALGRLILDILDQIDTTEKPEIGIFQQRVESELLNPSYQERSQVSCLLNDNIFRSGYVEILDFLNNITVKSVEEKAVFFRHLHHQLQELPSKMIANRLLHLLLSRCVLVDPVAVETFLPHLLTPLSESNCIKNDQSTNVTPLLPEKLYKECCIPILGKLFEVNDRHVRLILLKYFPLYVTMFELPFLKNVIMHQLLTGLRESDDELVSATFSALQYLVPLLGSKIVIGGERIQQFTERRPKFDSQTLLNDAGVKKQPHHATTVPLLNKVKLSECKSAEQKMKEREKRRQETRQRNEERRKHKQLLQMEKMMTKNAVLVEKVHDVESGDEFESCGDLSGERDLSFEVSDGSEHGRPSSSEVSLDSGFSEKTLTTSSVTRPPSPRQLRKHYEERFEKTAKKNPLPGKGRSGMKLGKSKDKSKKEKNLGFPSNSCDGGGGGGGGGGGDKTILDRNMTSSTNDRSKNIDKGKAIDTPWEDFGINVTKNNSVEDDLFADMEPTLSSAPKAPVKGTSMYCDILAVDSTLSEVADGWLDEDW